MATELLYTKGQVGFEHPAKGPDHCSQCQHYRNGEHACEIVIGWIEGQDWCRKFKEKTNAPV